MNKDEIIQEKYSSLVKIAKRATQGSQLWQDYLQDFCLWFLTHEHNIQSIESYAYTSIRNKWLKGNTSKSVSLDFDIQESHEDNEMLSLLEDAIAKLPVDAQLYLASSMCASVPEISAETGVPSKRIYRNLHKIREYIKKEIQDEQRRNR